MANGKISKRYSCHSYKYFTTKLFVDVHSNTSHKSYLLEFWNLKKIEIFVNMGLCGREIFNTVISLQLWFFLNQTCCAPSVWPRVTRWRKDKTLSDWIVQFTLKYSTKFGRWHKSKDGTAIATFTRSMHTGLKLAQW